jgi:hypothetical protein
VKKERNKSSLFIVINKEEIAVLNCGFQESGTVPVTAVVVITQAFLQYNFCLVRG